jgi:hypothetical protein
MGWTAYHKDGSVTNEGEHGRPVQAGEEGQLRGIVQEDFGHKVYIDLIGGAIVLDYEALDVQGGNIAVVNPAMVLYVCDETNIVGDLFKLRKTRPNKDGDYKQVVEPFVWRPIWFTRVTNGTILTKIVGLQTTLGVPYKRKNIKKMISLFEDGRVGID